MKFIKPILLLGSVLALTMCGQDGEKKYTDGYVSRKTFLQLASQIDRNYPFNYATALVYGNDDVHIVGTEYFELENGVWKEVEERNPDFVSLLNSSIESVESNLKSQGNKLEYRHTGSGDHEYISIVCNKDDEYLYRISGYGLIYQMSHYSSGDDYYGVTFEYSTVY